MTKFFFLIDNPQLPSFEVQQCFGKIWRLQQRLAAEIKQNFGSFGLSGKLGLMPKFSFGKCWNWNLCDWRPRSCCLTAIVWLQRKRQKLYYKKHSLTNVNVNLLLNTIFQNINVTNTFLRAISRIGICKIRVCKIGICEIRICAQLVI